MPAGIKVAGTDAFHRVARQCHEAGRGDLARNMGKGMKRAAEPVRQEMQSEVRGVRTTATGAGRRLAASATRRGGASARAQRAAHALRNRKKITDRARLKAHRQSGLREYVARATRSAASVTARTASVRIRAVQAQMPPSQRKLPRLMNRGQWRHPVFKEHASNHWVTQKVSPAGWFDRPARRGGPRVRQAAVDVVIRTLNKLGQG